MCNSYVYMNAEYITMYFIHNTVHAFVGSLHANRIGNTIERES